MKIAILGFGTIGKGVFELLSGRTDIIVKRILDLRKWNDLMTTDFSEITGDPEIELVVETMGGVEPARTYVLECLNKGKHVVTANKLLVSKCANELIAASRVGNKAFLFSAACGGGIPYLVNLQRTKDVDSVTELGGILNGTSNYILDQLQSNDINFSDALKKAQELGYAEKDPTSDIEGLDTVRKLILSCAVAFGSLITEAQVCRFGISNINESDIKYAKEHCKVIRLTAYAGLNEDKTLKAWVMPGLFNDSAPEASTKSNLNYIWYNAEKSGVFGYSGQGAGSLPTAANIVKDIISISEDTMNMLPGKLSEAVVKNTDKRSFYVRMPAKCDISMLPAEKTTEVNGYTVIETMPMCMDELDLSCIKANNGSILLK